IGGFTISGAGAGVTACVGVFSAGVSSFGF
ncbi:hypothetical protein A2U01_0087925, partial [Trifolium medium]|nr:hypothetical protein [Trifolium medium]